MWPLFPRIPAATAWRSTGARGPGHRAMARSASDVQMHAGKGKEPMAPMPVPSKYKLVPEGTRAARPTTSPRPTRYGRRLRAGRSFDVDFNLAVTATSCRGDRAVFRHGPVREVGTVRGALRILQVLAHKRAIAPSPTAERRL